MRKSRVIRVMKYSAVDHHREILEDAREGGGREAIDLVSRSREREGKMGRVGRISHGSIRILRTNVTRLVVVESLAEGATCLTHINGVSDEETRRYFQIQPRNSWILAI